LRSHDFKNGLLDRLLPGFLLLAGGLAWEAAVRWWELPHYLLPGPGRILAVCWNQAGLLLFHGAATLAEVGLGLALATAGGMLLALLMHRSRTMERTLMPLIVASQTIPVFAVAPLLVLWFGYGLGSKVVMTAVIVFFPVVVNTARGLAAADPDMVALLTILEATPRQIFFKVRLPQALPYVFAGLKIGAAVSVIGAVIGEWVGAQRGLGYLMIHANAQLQVELVFAAIFYLSVLGVVLYGAIGWLERLLTPWAVNGNSI
jgi:ABC-type nitrate/sulfonate/bicarbonate transport system permease component